MSLSLVYNMDHFRIHSQDLCILSNKLSLYLAITWTKFYLIILYISLMLLFTFCLFIFCLFCHLLRFFSETKNFITHITAGSKSIMFVSDPLAPKVVPQGQGGGALCILHVQWASVVSEEH